MFGKLLSSVIKVATLPLDATNIVLNAASGGTGSKASRTNGLNPLGELEKVRDNIADAAKEVDE